MNNQVYQEETHQLSRDATTVSVLARLGHRRNIAALGFIAIRWQRSSWRDDLPPVRGRRRFVGGRWNPMQFDGETMLGVVGVRRLRAQCEGGRACDVRVLAQE
jgi:hypothetical protein